MTQHSSKPILSEPIPGLGTWLDLGRTETYAIRVNFFGMNEEFVKLGAVGYQIVNVNTGVIEGETSYLPQAIEGTRRLEAALAEALNPTQVASLQDAFPRGDSFN